MGHVSLQKSCAVVALGLAAALAAPTAGARTIYSVNFDQPGASGFLNGATPDVADNSGGEIGTSTPVWLSGSAGSPGPGANANDIKADGTVITTAPSPALATTAYLPFTPASGHVYQLQATLNDTSTSGNGRWLAVGFTQNTNEPLTTGPSRWVDASGGPNAVAWMLHRQQGYSATSVDQTFLGPATANPAGTSANVTDPVGSLTSPVDIRLTLDTTTPLWTVTWAMKNDANPGDPYTAVRTTQFATNPTIGEVGLFALDNTQGQFSNFALNDVTPAPEPAALGLAAIAVTALGVRRRRV